MRNYNSGRSSGRGGQDSRNRSFNRRDSGRVEMHDAICDKCGDECQVPFRPSSNKPIFCSRCFAEQNGENYGRSDNRASRRFDRNDYRSERRRDDRFPSFRDRDGSSGNDRGRNRDQSSNQNSQNNQMNEQLNRLSSKLDEVIRRLDTLTSKTKENEKLHTKIKEVVPAKASKKKVIKKDPIIAITEMPKATISKKSSAVRKTVKKEKRA